MNAWTPEPWSCGDAACGCVYKQDGPIIAFRAAETPWKANRNRIVSCVNACQGLPDPAAELARLRQCEAALRRIMEWWEGDAWIDMPAPDSLCNAARAALEGLQ